MKITNTNRQRIAARLRALRQAKIGAFALLSVSTLRALSAIEERAHSRITRETVSRSHNRADETPEEAEIVRSRIADTMAAEIVAEGNEAARLTVAERAAIQAARPGSRSLVLFATPAPAPEEPLPADYVAAPVAPYVAALDSLDAAELALADAEGKAEAVAALARMESEIAAIPAHAPVAIAAPKPAKVRAVEVAPTPRRASFADMAGAMLRAAGV